MDNKINPEQLLRSGSSVQLPPTGFSMYPFINPDKKDQVIIEPCDISLLKKGDVVLYRRTGEKGELNTQNVSGGILVLHRIWKRSKDDFYMVGDNQAQIEGPIKAGQICGKMTAIVHCLGKKNVPVIDSAVPVAERAVSVAERTVSVTDTGYRIKSGIWLFLRPCRPAISHFISGIKKFIRRISS